MSESERIREAARFCGYCGGRLPDLGAGVTGACPNCRRLFAASPGRDGGTRGGGGPRWAAAGGPGEAGRTGAGGPGRTAAGGPGWSGAGGPGWSGAGGPGWSGACSEGCGRPGTCPADPMVAALSGALIPGAGQVVNGQFLKGFLVFLTCWLVVPYLLGIIDAYITAWNRTRPSYVHASAGRERFQCDPSGGGVEKESF